MQNEQSQKVWEEPTLKYVGHIGEVIQSGGGKLSVYEFEEND